MDDGKVLLGRRWNGDVWDSFGGRRQSRKEREREMAQSISKLRTMGPVPAIDRVERFQLWDAGAFHDAHQIQAGIGNCAGAVCKANQGKHRARRPYFGVLGAGLFQGRKGKNDVANGSRPNEQASFIG